MRNLWKKVKCFPDVISGVILMACCVILYVQTYEIKMFSGLSDSVGPRFFPRVLLVVLAVMAVLLIIGGIAKGLHALCALPESDCTEKKKESFEGTFLQKVFHAIDVSPKVRTWISIAGMFVFILLLEPLGFAISATLYLFVQFFLLAPPEKRWKKMWFYIILAVFFGVGSYILFRYAISINLPAGILKSIL